MVRQAVLPAIGEFLLELIREYTISTIPYYRDIRQLLYRQRKGLSTAKNSITSQEHDWPGKLYVTLRFEVPGLQGCKVIFAWANLRLPVESDLLAVAKAIDDRDRNTILSTGVVPDIDDDAFQGFEITSKLVKSGSQSPLFNAFQLKDPNVAKFTGPAVVKHPCLGLRRPSEPMADKSLLGRFEELLDLSLCEFLTESGLFLWAEVSCLPIPACFGLQLDMPVIQRTEHLTEDIEELIIAGLICNFGSVGVILLFPIDIPQFEKWVSVVEGLPQKFEILFRVANVHVTVNLSVAARLSLISKWNIESAADDTPKWELSLMMDRLVGTVGPDVEAKQERSGLGSGREIAHQLYNEFGDGKLDSVNFQGVPADEAQRPCYGLWRLDAARAGQE